MSNIIFFISILWLSFSCASLPKKEEIVVFIKPRGMDIGYPKKDKKLEWDASGGISIKFPEEFRNKEKSIAIVVNKNLIDGVKPVYTLLDRFGGLNIKSVEESANRTIVNLEISTMNDLQINLSKEPMSLEQVNIYHSPYEYNHCQAIYLHKKNIYITNNHCFSTADECNTAKVENLGKSSTCKDILYTDPLYDITIFTTKTKFQPSHFIETNKGKGHDNSMASIARDNIACKRALNEGEPNIVVDQSGVIKIASFLSECSSQITKGYSGSPVVDSENELIGLLWGFYELHDNRQLITYIPINYLENIFSHLEARGKF